MAKRTSGLDQLFQMAEQESNDSAFFPRLHTTASRRLRGVLPARTIHAQVKSLQALPVDAYIARSVHAF